MALANKIIVGENNETRELKGEELKTFNSMREKMHAEYIKLEAEQQAKEAARESAMAKLKALGLTDDEISALVP